MFRKHLYQPVLILSITVTAIGQEAASTAPLDRLSAAMQDYARGITENQFDVSCKLSRFDNAGKLQKTKNTTHRLEFTKGSYKSSAAGEGSTWSGTFVTHGGRSTSALEGDTDDGAFLQIFVFAPASRKRFEFSSQAAANENAVTVSYRSRYACKSFEPEGKGFRMIDSSCGSGQVVFDEAAPVAFRGSFETSGFPLTSGNEILRGHHIDSEFAMVAVAGAKRPFLFPKKIVTTLLFGDARVTVDCAYNLHPDKRK